MLDEALSTFAPHEHQWEPRKVFLFSGHRVDERNRRTPRFPNATLNIDIAQQAITEGLANFDAGPEDLALTQGACGGDLLFTKASLQLGLRVQWLQPFAEPDFIHHSVACGGEQWRACYFALKSQLGLPIRHAPEVLGPLPAGADLGDAYERGNRWLLSSALSYGTEKIHFICLWDGDAGDGRGGTKHMLDEVSARTDHVKILDTRTLW